MSITQCELCGRECACRPALVDGVRMMLCPGCMRHGQGVREIERPTTDSSSQTLLSRIKRPKVKDVYKDMDKELVSDWNERIKRAREKKGISREDLGFKIGERTVTIAKIENGDLRPSDQVVKKLEKELEITLVEEVKDTTPLSYGSHGQGLTLGDFIKTEKK
ncbi:MAG: TIGR00270 family protein [Candidatus Thermoplasmatota archaeon]|nr:TIGR00270 family protein [Candidatus Thermoplasmatota archaeon]